LLREIADSVGAAILMVTHSAPAAAQADRVLRLEPDRLLELNRPQGQWAP
jgi:ABC-type lipoprotein export system ATPase subunit